MSKKEAVQEVHEDKVNQPANAPIAPEYIQNVDAETHAHQWQADSAALNTNALAGYAPNDADSVVAKVEAAAKEDEAAKKKEEISTFEYDRRTKLDVSNPQYINPSLDHFKVK